MADQQNQTLSQLLAAGDRPLRLGDLVPSINEVHALALGGAIGLLLGEAGLGLKTILTEPHYALAAFATAYLFARERYR